MSKAGREGGREREREGGREEGREGGREGGREEGGREGGREEGGREEGGGGLAAKAALLFRPPLGRNLERGTRLALSALEGHQLDLTRLTTNGRRLTMNGLAVTIAGRSYGPFEQKAVLAFITFIGLP